jgi:hypothetical protein
MQFYLDKRVPESRSMDMSNEQGINTKALS